ncbi:hypothetical protein E5D57_010056 [Metarhizium anisopliae]|nr:hypothetical protein E5D57_010056 [Metarhizium anisopliae]
MPSKHEFSDVDETCGTARVKVQNVSSLGFVLYLHLQRDLQLYLGTRCLLRARRTCPRLAIIVPIDVVCAAVGCILVPVLGAAIEGAIRATRSRAQQPILARVKPRPLAGVKLLGVLLLPADALLEGNLEHLDKGEGRHGLLVDGPLVEGIQHLLQTLGDQAVLQALQPPLLQPGGALGLHEIGVHGGIFDAAAVGFADEIDAEVAKAGEGLEDRVDEAVVGLVPQTYDGLLLGARFMVDGEVGPEDVDEGNGGERSSGSIRYDRRRLVGHGSQVGGGSPGWQLLNHSMTEERAEERKRNRKVSAREEWTMVGRLRSNWTWTGHGSKAGG